jgi:hypothetical protein
VDGYIRYRRRDAGSAQDMNGYVAVLTAPIGIHGRKEEIV